MEENTPDIEIEDTSSEHTITHPFNPNDIRIETPPYTIGYLMDKIEHDEINMNTDFQRDGDLWSEDKQSRLIESILLGLPLPAFYFDSKNRSKWDIIDGLQRCCSIKNFCVDKKLRLKGLEFLRGKENLGFDDLDRTWQRSIITRPITVNLIVDADDSVRYILFKRLNTGGLELTNAEIRNAVYSGIPSDVIKDLAQLKEFKSATENRIPTKRMVDRDFVSRFIAFYLIDYTKYEPGLDDFINKSMEILKSSDINIEKLKSDFRNALNLSHTIFGKDAFRKRTDINANRMPINKAYFEVITESFSRLPEKEREMLLKNQSLFKNNLITLIKNDRYSYSLSNATGKKDRVHIRFSWFKQVLDISIKGQNIKIDDNKITSY